MLNRGHFLSIFEVLAHDFWKMRKILTGINRHVGLGRNLDNIRIWHRADRLKRLEGQHSGTGVRYFEVGRLLNPLPRFVNDLLAILFGKRSFLAFG